MKVKKLAHTVYKTQYHIVWITRFRRKILVEGVKQYLEVKLHEIRKYYPDREYIRIGIDYDHVYLHMVISAEVECQRCGGNDKEEHEQIIE